MSNLYYQLIVILALIVALCLAGLALYFKNENNKSKLKINSIIHFMNLFRFKYKTEGITQDLWAMYDLVIGNLNKTKKGFENEN